MALLGAVLPQRLLLVEGVALDLVHTRRPHDRSPLEGLQVGHREVGDADRARLRVRVRVRGRGRGRGRVRIRVRGRVWVRVRTRARVRVRNRIGLKFGYGLGLLLGFWPGIGSEAAELEAAQMRSAQNQTEPWGS